jgi:6-phosphogluconolactonase (cycloisomerase 2 family)
MGALLLLLPAASWAADDAFVVNSGTGISSVSAYTIGATGALTADGTPVTTGTTASSEPVDDAVSPNGRFLFVPNSTEGTVSTFSIASDGTLTQQGTAVISGTSDTSNPQDIAIAPDGQSLYIPNSTEGTVSTFSIASDGTLTQQGTGVVSGTGAASGAGAVAVSPSGRYLFVTNNTAGTVSTFSIGAGGLLTQQGTGVPSGQDPFDLTETPDGRYLYVTNFEAGTVSAFAVGADGALTAVGTAVSTGSSAGAGPDYPTVSPDGRFLYVSNYLEGTLATFSIGAGGVPTTVGTPVASDSAPNPYPEGIWVSQDGQHVYAANGGIGTISIFTVGSDGGLTQQGTSVTDPGASAIVLAPDQGPTGAFSDTVADAGSPTTFTAQASTAGSVPISTYSWQFGDGATATGPTASHVYAKPGSYEATLRVTDGEACSVFGPFVGHSPYCQSDPGASLTKTITVAAVPKPGRPTASHGSITGIARNKPKLALTVTAGKNAPAIETVALTSPRGLRFSSSHKLLTRDVNVKGAKFTAAVSHGTLKLKLKRSQTRVVITIRGPALFAAKRVTGKAKHHKLGKLTFALKITDAHGTSTRLSLKLTDHG